MSPLVLLHICGGVVGILAGLLAMAYRKGSGGHRLAGTIFFVSMLCMSGSGAFMAAFIRPNRLNVIAGLLTFYLVLTSWVTARRREGGTGAFDIGAGLVILAVGVSGVTFAFTAKTQAGTIAYAVFGTTALLFAASDVRMIVRGGVTGAKRIARHLWRMGLALTIAALSLYPGQAKQFSAALRATNLMFVPLVLSAGLTIFWLVRISSSGTRKTKQPVHSAEPLPQQAAA